MPDWIFLVNPTAGKLGGTEGWRQTVMALQKSGVSFEYWISDHPGALSALLEQSLQAGYRKVVGVGGDGTHHQLVNALLRQQICPTAEITYSLLPRGSGNDWARGQGIPFALQKWIQYLQQGTLQWKDAGEVRQGNRLVYFANVAGMGFDAEVVRSIEKKGISTKNGWKYFLEIFSCLGRFQAQPIRLKSDSLDHRGPCLTVHLGLSPWSGGGMRFVPHAGQKEGQLALTIIEKMSTFQLVANLYRLYTGSLLRHPRVKYSWCETADVQPDRDAAWWLECDGETIGPGSWSFRVLPKAYRCVSIEK